MTFITAVAKAAVGWFVAARVARAIVRKRALKLSKETEKLASSLATHREISNDLPGANPAISFPSSSVGKRIRHRKIPVKMVMLVADDVYSKVGLLKNTPANKLVIGDLVRKCMVARKMRAFDIAQQAPIAVAMCFMPRDSEILANQILQSTEMSVRVEAAEGDYARYHAPWRRVMGAVAGFLLPGSNPPSAPSRQ